MNLLWISRLNSEPIECEELSWQLRQQSCEKEGNACFDEWRSFVSCLHGFAIFTVDVQKWGTWVSFFHFLNNKENYFAMSFLKCIVSICHSFQSTAQPSWINGFERCFQAVDRCTAWHHRVTPVLAKTQIKLYEPDMGKQKPVRGIMEPLWGITKPTEGINKPYKIWEILS